MPSFVDSWLIPIVSIFFIVDPLAAVPAFLTMTAGDPPGKRRAMALKASVASTVILIVFATAGGLRYSALLHRVLGKTGIHVLSRLMGLVLATMALQFVLDGLREGGYVKLQAGQDAVRADRV